MEEKPVADVEPPKMLQTAAKFTHWRWRLGTNMLLQVVGGDLTANLHEKTSADESPFSGSRLAMFAGCRCCASFELASPAAAKW